jgi:hypothetical protein
MPGIGVRTAARILLEVGDASNFASSGHLAAYAGIAPVTRSSGTSIKGEHPARTGNRQLKRAFFLAAFAALSDPTSRAYYDRKRAEGKKHNAALICNSAHPAGGGSRVTDGRLLRFATRWFTDEAAPMFPASSSDVVEGRGTTPSPQLSTAFARPSRNPPSPALLDSEGDA